MISVMMPVYNGQEFLKAAIDSVLLQTEPDFELIIVNDGSTDGTEEIALSYNDDRIRYEKQSNKGRAAARERALSLCRGEFITFQDADDISLPTRLEELKKGFVSTSVGLVHSDMFLIDNAGQPIGLWQSENICKADLLRFFVRIGTPFNNPSMMIRRSCFADFHFDTNLEAAEDTDMIFRISEQMHSFHVSKPLLLYRRHTGNIGKHQGKYERLAQHVRKLIEAHTLEELVPEIDWRQGNDDVNRSVAQAILALLLSRRGMQVDAVRMLEKAFESVENNPQVTFLLAMQALINGDFVNALQLLLDINPTNHIVDNYVGETLCICGRHNEAFQFFMRSIHSWPHYSEPMNNIKALGRIQNLVLLDGTWQSLIKQV